MREPISMVWGSLSRGFVFEARGSNGFTLIELLAVVMLLGLLAVLIVPAAKKLKGSGERATCAGNLRQIGAGVAVYASENNMTLPPGTEYSQETYSDGSLGPLRLGNFLGFPEQYMDLGPSKPWKTFACPSDYTKDRGDDYCSYARNYMFFVNYTNGVPTTYRNDVPTIRQPVRLEEARNKILYVDGIAPEEARSWTGEGRPPNVNRNGVAAALLSQFADRTISSRHLGSVNCLFGDGSVRLMPHAEACEAHYLDRD